MKELRKLACCFLGRLSVFSALWGLLTPCGSFARAEDRVTLENVVAPSPNTPDEPLAKAFSLEKAAAFLDAASLSWQKERGCGTCHTNYAYLMARPSLRGVHPEAPEVRAFFENMIEKTWDEKGPRFDAELVAAAAAMAFHDAQSTGKLHPLTRKALDRMWTKQRSDGGWDWLKCNWPPMESDDHYGVTLAALAVGMAPEGYAQTSQAQEGMAKIHQYLKDNPAPMLHHRAMILWASRYQEGFMNAAEQQATLDELLALQRPDGGWAVATLGDWKRADDKEQDRENSDGYATGLVIYLARQRGVPASDRRLQRGIAWLKSHQRESGRWFTRSLNRDNKHYLTHAGTAFAIMALHACGEVPTATAAAN